MKENINKVPPKGKVKFSITLSEEQKSAKTPILYHPYNFVMGKAGSGKTLLAVQIALDMFFTRKINKIIITRPTVSNEDNGYLPGSLDEKMEPWLVPIRSNMRKVYNKPAILQKMESDENIELVSLYEPLPSKADIQVKSFPELLPKGRALGNLRGEEFF